MIDFRPIELGDQERIRAIVCASGCHGADYSFADLYMWRATYRPYLAILGDRLVIHMPETGGLYAYPKGAGDVRPVLEAMLSDAHERGSRLVMRGLTEPMLEELMTALPGRFSFVENREDADYIYTVEKLRDLRGRKLSSKRNHIRHFEQMGDWTFRRIHSEDLPEAQAFVARWYDLRQDPSLEAEAKAIAEMFRHYDALGFFGGMLYQHGKPVAFTAATRLDELTVDVHFEKALADVEGAYPTVNREFARLISETYPEVQYINREEDAGIEGLRRAKESYQPDVLLRKYTATER